MNYKKYIVLLVVFLLFSSSVFAMERIDAKKNAYIHNNKGLIYLQDKYYFGAIKEFQMAINLNPKSQAAAVYYTNLATTYEAIGYPNLALPCFEKALNLNALSFNPYLRLAESYKKNNVAEKKLEELRLNKTSPLDEVMIGLLFIQIGQVTTGITVLDEFANKEPNLMLSIGVKNYIKELTKD